MTLITLIPIVISVAALAVSCAALYVANFWKGKVICSKPTQFFFGYANKEKTAANISVQCFIHSTGTVGQVIDHVFLELKQGEVKQRFTSWSAGTTAANRIKLAGFKVPRDGHSIDFIFFTPPKSTSFKFSTEPITISFNARLSGSKKHKILLEETFDMNAELCDAIDSLGIAAFELNSTGDHYSGYPSKYTLPLSSYDDNTNSVDNLEFEKLIDEKDAKK